MAMSASLATLGGFLGVRSVVVLDRSMLFGVCFLAFVAVVMDE